MKINFDAIIEKLNRLDIKARYAVFAGSLLFIVAVDVFIIMGFQWQALKNMDSKNQSLVQNMDSLKLDLQRIDQMKVGLQNFRSQLEAMNMKIRPVGEAYAIQEELSRLANDNDVKIDQFTRQAQAPQLLVAADALKYYALPIVIQASSGYHMFGRFLNQLESGKLFFTLSSLSIQNQGVNSRRHLINATLKVVLSDKNTDGPKK